jgi:hypothetical protein
VHDWRALSQLMRCEFDIEIAIRRRAKTAWQSSGTVEHNLCGGAKARRCRTALHSPGRTARAAQLTL